MSESLNSLRGCFKGVYGEALKPLLMRILGAETIAHVSHDLSGDPKSPRRVRLHHLCGFGS